MDPGVVILILAIVNIPVYLFLAWVAFDSKQNAGREFGDTIRILLKLIFVPRIVRVLRGDDEDGLDLLPMLGFLLACGGIVYGEFYLLNKWLGLTHA